MNATESALPAARPATRLQKSMRGTLRWGLATILAFGLGVLLVALVFYLPTWQKLDKANATLGSQTNQIATLKTDNETLQQNLASATLHMYILKALSGVRAANLAAATDDYAGARLALIQASEAVDKLSGLLGKDQSDVLTAMQQSAAQVLVKMQLDLKSAQPDLEQLTKNLVQLERNLFPNP